MIGVSVPALEPGALGDAIVTLQNRGNATWTDEFRLASAPGCPEAAHANAIAWEPTAGYVNGLLDARVFLPHAVAPGETVEIRVPLRAPAEPGEYTFAARMVHEGIELFGPTVSGTVTVAAGAGSVVDTDDDSAGNQSDSVGGCSTSDAPRFWVVFALGIFLPRRRTA